jgi:opacity protein-like surface antigen
MPLVAAAALLLTVAGVRAHDGTIPRFAAEINSGTVSVKEAGFGSGWKYGGGVFFRTGHRMGVEILLEKYGVPVALGAGGLESAGRMNTTTLLLNEQLYIFTKGRVLPYALAGIGFTFIGWAPDAWPAGTPEKAFVDRLALQLGGGLVVRVSRGLFVTGRARWNLVKTWIETLPRTVPIRETDPLAQDMLQLYGLELGLGIKLAF